MKVILFLALAILLQCCASNDSVVKKDAAQAAPKKLKADSVQVIASFKDVAPAIEKYPLYKARIDSLCSGGDFISFGAEFGGFGKSEYGVKLEKSQGDSSWFIKRTISYQKDYSDYAPEKGPPSEKWLRTRIDTIADTTKFLTIMNSMETFAPETTMVESYVVFDANVKFLDHKKEDRCIGASIENGYLWDSPGLYSLYDELKQWTIDDLVKIEFRTDSNLIEAQSKIDETVTCRVIDLTSYEKGLVPSFEIKKGVQEIPFDFSKLGNNDGIFCESDLGLVRGVFYTKRI